VIGSAGPRSGLLLLLSSEASAGRCDGAGPDCCGLVSSSVMTLTLPTASLTRLWYP
jgi:hypothetical protein